MTKLPEPLPTYFSAQDLTTLLGTFTEDAVVADEGRVHTGQAAIRAWREEASLAYTYTTEVTGVRDAGDGQWVVSTHLTGDFPGGEVDLDQRFTIRAGRIAALSHEVS